MHGSDRSPIPGLGTEQLARLLREQVGAALREAIGRLPEFGRSAKLKAAAAVIGLYGGGALVATLILLLALAMPAWVAGLIVGVALLVVAAVVRTMAKTASTPAESAATPSVPTSRE
ncbi:phage holin family protein [Nocardia terrae]|nr:phage holin family protein [Nocardia terrae]